jgi:hypothetical protein
MTRKDFIAVAAALGQSLAQQNLSALKIQAIAEQFAHRIAHTNPSFDHARFVKAVTVATKG